MSRLFYLVCLHLLVFNLMDRFCNDLCLGQSEKGTRHGIKLVRAERLLTLYNRSMHLFFSLPCGNTAKVFLSASFQGRHDPPEISLNFLSPRFSKSISGNA